MLFHVNDILCGLFKFFVDAETKRKGRRWRMYRRTDRQTDEAIDRNSFNLESSVLSTRMFYLKVYVEHELISCKYIFHNPKQGPLAGIQGDSVFG